MRSPFVATRAVIGIFVILLIGATPSGAQAVRQTARLDESYVFPYFNPCSGETLVIYTHVMTFTRLMLDGNGGSHFHFNGVWHYRAASPTTGVEYVGTETGNWSMLVASGGTVNDTYESQGHLIGKGPADDLHIHTFMKLTVTPDGKVATEIAGQTVDCRG
jgi:hypothetical protein